MAWEWDAPTGVYRNHTLSSKIRRAAVAQAQFMRFLRAEPGYGKGKGAGVSITRIFSLPRAGKVSETDRLPSGRPNIDTKTIYPDEWGYKIEMTEFEKNLTHFDLTNQFQLALKDQMRLTMDEMAATSFKATPYKYIPQASGGVFDTDGTPSTAADTNLSVAALRDIHDVLQGELKCPRYANGKYVGILSTRAARGIKNDPEYKDWFAPSTSEPFVTGRLKDVEEFMLIETNHYDALANAVGTNGVCGEAVFFGMDASALATVEEPELRAGLPEDLGRFREIGWVGTLGADTVWDIAAHARCVHVTSQ